MNQILRDRLAALAADFGRLALTLAMTAGAVLVGWRLWVYYQEEPWTRDGRVRADIVQIAPDVSGLVARVLVHDNQRVAAGTPLFEIDPARYRLAVQQAEAALAAQQAIVAQARRTVARNRTLDDLVAQEAREEALSRAENAEAALLGLRVARDKARLDLDRTMVRAPVAGVLSGLQLQPGDYVTAGKAAFALMDSASLHVAGYFEETKLRHIHVGDAVEVQLMGDATVLHGHVESIAPAIEDRDRSDGTSLLPNVNPTFSWVRLAQRVPVRIALDEADRRSGLVAGRTATVRLVATPEHGA